MIPLRYDFPFGLRPGEGGWTYGRWEAVDGPPPSVVREEDVAEVLYQGASGDRWDGIEAAVLRLHDGRYVAWEAMYGPTGHGFCDDAYGGDAVVYFGTDLARLIRAALTDEGRASCGIPAEGLAS